MDLNNLFGRIIKEARMAQKDRNKERTWKALYH